MGLDITGISYVKILGTTEEFNEDLDNMYGQPGYIHQEYIHPSFPHAVPVGLFGRLLRWQETEGSDSIDFRAGSYSGYGRFRDALYSLDYKSFLITKTEGTPAFYEFINFSDCEGVMFGPVCEKLYNDFVNMREKFSAQYNNDKYYLTLYDDWTRAFDLGRHDGLVSLH